MSWAAGAVLLAALAAAAEPAPLAEGTRPGEQWTDGVGIPFCWCPPGRFTMGLADDDPAPDATDASAVEVTISRGFWLARHELTQDEYFRITKRKPPPETPLVDPAAPLTHVAYNQATGICQRLTEADRKAGRLPAGWRYTLPSEAQWEYACRAGSRGSFSWGNDLARLPAHANVADRRLRAEAADFHYAWPDGDDGVGARPALVEQYAANAWGLHDMHGNVAEWCRDIYAPTLAGGTDPTGPEKADEHARRVLRGGAWCSLPATCRSGYRNHFSAHNNAVKPPFAGVRLAVVREQEAAP